MFAPSSTILFQGDSITDAKRSRSASIGPHPEDLGYGYVNLLAGRILASQPGDDLTIINRGISGNRIVDLYARVLVDTINLAPDYLSVLIGVNDTWHHFRENNGVPLPKFERIYRAYLDEVLEARPDLTLILAEPFVLPAGPVTPEWRKQIDERRSVVHSLVNDYEAIFVPWQTVFDEAINKAPAAYWADDGVHPTVAGHSLMADCWWQAVSQSLA